MASFQAIIYRSLLKLHLQWRLCCLAVWKRSVKTKLTTPGWDCQVLSWLRAVLQCLHHSEKRYQIIDNHFFMVVSWNIVFGTVNHLIRALLLWFNRTGITVYCLPPPLRAVSGDISVSLESGNIFTVYLKCGLWSLCKVLNNGSSIFWGHFDLKNQSANLWVQVNVCIKYEEVPSRYHKDTVFTPNLHFVTSLWHQPLMYALTCSLSHVREWYTVCTED